MRFWDTSGIIPLLVIEPATQPAKEILRADDAVVVWWGTPIECISALVRRTREGMLDGKAEDQARNVLRRLAGLWTEVHPTQIVRDTAERLLTVHSLRAADALQLAAALVWVGRNPAGQHFVCLDHNLRAAARREGFILLPA